MLPDFVPLSVIVIVLVVLAYFFMASIPFLFVRLDIPEVSRLFRGLFNVHFRIVGVIGLVAAAAFALSWRFGFAVPMLLVALAAIAGRTRVIEGIDTQQNAWQAGDKAAMRRLRLIHWGVMLVNFLVLAAVARSLSFIV
jgi:hypothetical protein